MRVCIAAVLYFVASFAIAEEPMRRVLGEGYEIFLPASWQEQATLSPSGQPIRLFWERGSLEKGVGCTIEVARIDIKTMPMLARLSFQQKRELLLAQWDMGDWFALLPNLTSTADFKVINNFKTTIGGNMPASALEYSYRLQNGYHYRTRLLFTLSRDMQYVLSCFGFGRSDNTARDGFQRSVTTFQKIHYSFMFRGN